MDPDERRDILRTLESGKDDFLKAVAVVPGDLAGRSPGPGRWSALQCVEHVAIAEEYLLSQVYSSKRADAPVVNGRREAAIRKNGPERTKPVESPEVGRPTGRFLSIAQAVQHFLACRERTVQFVETCNEDLRSMLTHHPLIGPVNCHEMLLMMAVHPQRHAKQIEEVTGNLAALTVRQRGSPPLQ